MSNGSLVGLGKDNNLYWRSSLGNNWIQVPNGVSMNVVAQKNDGSFIGQGTDGKVYVCPYMGASWSSPFAAAAQPSIVFVDTMLDGTFLGVGSDNTLYTSSQPKSTD